MTRTLYRKPALLALTLALLTSACTIGDPYQRPRTGQPEDWKYQQYGTSAAWPTRDWWNNFGAKPLSDLMTEALAANYDIKTAIDNVRMADAQVKVVGAALLPNVDASAGITHAMQSNSGRGTGTAAGGYGGGTIYDSYTANANASYEVDFWGKNRALTQAQAAAAQASYYAEQTTILTVTSDVATTYFTILESIDRLAAARKNLADTQALLAAYQQRLQQGTASALDVAQQENVVASERALLPAFVQTLQQNCDALAILTGRLPETIDVSTLELPNGLAGLAVPAVGAGLPSRLLERRPDVLEAEENLVSANAQITVARAAFLPDIALTGEYGVASAALNTLFQPSSLLYSVGGTLTQSVFSGGQLEGQLDYDKAAYDAMLNTYRKAALSAFQDVEDALSAVNQMTEAEAAQKEALDTAQTAFDLTERQMAYGTIDITAVLNTERSLFAAQDAYIVARAQRLAAIVQLYNALGGGWQNSGIIDDKNYPLLPILGQSPPRTLPQGVGTAPDDFGRLPDAAQNSRGNVN